MATSSSLLSSPLKRRRMRIVCAIPAPPFRLSASPEASSCALSALPCADVGRILSARESARRRHNRGQSVVAQMGITRHRLLAAIAIFVFAVAAIEYDWLSPKALAPKAGDDRHIRGSTAVSSSFAIECGGCAIRRDLSCLRSSCAVATRCYGRPLGR